MDGGITGRFSGYVGNLLLIEDPQANADDAKHQHQGYRRHHRELGETLAG
jgi:hypothetical protein